MLDATLQMAGVVGAFALVLGLAWAATRLLGGRLTAAVGSRLLRPLAALSLGRDRNLLLVEVAGKVYLVGAAPGSVRLLARIDDPAVLATVRPGGGGSAGEPFQQLLQRVLGGKGR